MFLEEGAYDGEVLFGMSIFPPCCGDVVSSISKIFNVGHVVGHIMGRQGNLYSAHHKLKFDHVYVASMVLLGDEAVIHFTQRERL